MNRFVSVVWINGVCKSKLIPSRFRWRLYKIGGLDFQQSTICDSARLHTEKIHVGRGAFINRNVLCQGQADIFIGENVSIACDVKLITVTHIIGSAEHRSGEQIHLPIEIENGTWIGAGCTILPGCKISNGCVVASGSVVTKDLEENCLYGGYQPKK